MKSIQMLMLHLLMLTLPNCLVWLLHIHALHSLFVLPCIFQNFLQAFSMLTKLWKHLSALSPSLQGSRSFVALHTLANAKKWPPKFIWGYIRDPLKTATKIFTTNCIFTTDDDRSHCKKLISGGSEIAAEIVIFGNIAELAEKVFLASINRQKLRKRFLKYFVKIIMVAIFFELIYKG